jgi:hypothetical protein
MRKRDERNRERERGKIEERKLREKGWEKGSGGERGMQKFQC